MQVCYEREAAELLEKANADLEPELLTVTQARARLQTFVKIQRLAAFAMAGLARRIDDAEAVAKTTGTSLGKAKETLVIGKVLASSGELSEALKLGEVSPDQASEIAKAEEVAPGCAKKLVKVARQESYHVFKEKARKVKLEAEQHRDLGARQKEARYGRSYSDELGMVNIHLRLQPHVGTPIVARAEAEAQRLARAAKKATGATAKGTNDALEPFERYLADAYAGLLSGTGKGRAKRPELVVLVSHGVAKRGWKDVRKGEMCKIPGVGPVPPPVAKEIGQDAFLNALFYDGVDLRNLKRWTRSIPVEVQVALELGEPPGFDGVSCIDCGNKFRTEFDHVQPHVARGPTSNSNLKPRCWSCHQKKTERDRKAGKLKPPEP